MSEVRINCRACKGRGEIEFESGMKVKPCPTCRATGRDAYAERDALAAELAASQEGVAGSIPQPPYTTLTPWEDVARPMFEALEATTHALVFRPSCQRGIVDPCRCRDCALARAGTALHAFRAEQQKGEK